MCTEKVRFFYISGLPFVDTGVPNPQFELNTISAVATSSGFNVLSLTLKTKPVTIAFSGITSVFRVNNADEVPKPK
ncbi:hypothetical protein ACQKEY_00610 [Lysinibacillus fusiformis]|uniref:hypothetical protein n=1 Tax=Lysinibacillus fusiformis TaxID=28031 RepID=UPI003D09284C